jgi:Ca-activated chloride channel family protein
MFSNEIYCCQATSALKSVSFEGKLMGLLLTMTCKQNYENDDTFNKELLYHFPLNSGAKLMSLKFTLNGKEFIGDVYPKREAEERYENAINEGDSPILLSESTPGLYTAYLGNIKPGDVATVEFTYEELQRFGGDRIRICIPTVLAPRYGDMEASGELKPHENFSVNLLASYPISLSLDIFGNLGKAAISTPNHKSTLRVDEDRVNVSLNTGAFLDRDFVLLIEDIKDSQRSYALTSYDELAQNHTLLLSYCPTGLTKQKPLSLKILLDCSASMRGPSLTQSKIFVSEIIDQLTEDDYVSFNIFGSIFHSVTKRLVPATLTNRAQIKRFIYKCGPCMGDTELEKFLCEVLENDRGRNTSSDINHAVLLITDAEVVNSPRIVSKAKTYGQRVFSLGVGYSPVENLLAHLAGATSGSYEIAGPNEDMKTAAKRFLERMRFPNYPPPKMDWGQDPIWYSKLPRRIFNNETFHIFASFSDKPKTPPKVIFELEDGTCEVAPSEILETKTQNLSRLKGEVMFQENFRKSSVRSLTSKGKKALEIALGYKLISPLTSYFLVSARAEGDKADTIPHLDRIQQMMAKGHSWFQPFDMDNFICVLWDYRIKVPFNNIYYSSSDLELVSEITLKTLTSWAEAIKEFFCAPDSKALRRLHGTSLLDILKEPLKAIDPLKAYDYTHKLAEKHGLMNMVLASRTGLTNCIGILHENTQSHENGIYLSSHTSPTARDIQDNKDRALEYCDILPFLDYHVEIQHFLAQVILDEIERHFPGFTLSQAQIWCFIFFVHSYFVKPKDSGIISTLEMLIQDFLFDQESKSEKLSKILDITIVALLFPFEEDLLKLEVRQSNQIA